MRSKGDKRPRDTLIARVAANQHGVITTTQLARAGLSSGRIAERAAAGRLHRLHRGVYAVGHPRVSEHGRWMAAVLACGEGAVLSHLSAAELWGIRRRVRRQSEAGGRGGHTTVHVTIPSTAGKRRQNGIVLHRSSTLIASNCTRRDGIPVTKPGRTLADLHPLLSPAEFSAAVREAEFLGLPIGGTGDRNAESFDRDGTRTELEERMLAICRRHRLPQPEVNVMVDRYEVDFLWRERRLVVEVDGWVSHRTRSAFEEDRARDASLKSLGHDVLRFTWRQVTRDAHEVAKTIRALLLSGSSAAAGTGR
jgi:very-short-patch-repair endonuclease